MFIPNAIESGLSTTYKWLLAKWLRGPGRSCLCLSAIRNWTRVRHVSNNSRNSNVTSNLGVVVDSEAHARARVAADELSAEGEMVTARAVRTKAEVSMAVAAQIAREWKTAAETERTIPEIPSRVQVRVEGLWKEAIETVREEFETERQGWQTRLEELNQERDELIKEVTNLETKTSELQDTITTAHKENAATIKDLEAALTTVTSRADRAEAQVEALQEERDRLIEDGKASRALLMELATKGAEDDKSAWSKKQ